MRELVDHHLDLGGAPGRANTGDKMLTLVAWLAGGDCIRCAARWWDGRCSRLRGQGAIHPGDVPAQLPVGACPSTRPREPPVVGPGLGRWGRTRRLAPVGLDHLETYGLAKEGARHHGLPASGAITPCWPSPPAPASADGPLREGRANTARGAAHFLRETVSRVGGAGRQRFAACREMDVRFSITSRQMIPCGKNLSRRGSSSDLVRHICSAITDRDGETRMLG